MDNEPSWQDEKRTQQEAEDEGPGDLMKRSHQWLSDLNIQTVRGQWTEAPVSQRIDEEEPGARLSLLLLKIQKKTSLASG